MMDARPGPAAPPAPEPASAPEPSPGGTGAPREVVGLSREALAAALAALGLPRFRARQLWHWVYCRGATDFAAMTTFAKELRPLLARNLKVGRPGLAREQVSADGTRKWLLRLADGNLIETVFIPEEERGTLCISSQVGCTLTCRFCFTGTQRLVRNLGPAEIVGQVMLARDRLSDWPSNAPGRAITNVVLMGMGEPLFNYDNVAAAIRILLDGEGLGLSRRRITLSTSGVVPMIERAGAELGVNLAISLHAATDELRSRLMPINKKYPLAELIGACRRYPGASNARRITFEYVMLKGVNDSPADAKRLVRLIAGIPAKVNLIPFNPWPGAPFECAEAETIAGFADIVAAAGYTSPVRTPRGRDIMAACGQLRSDSIRPRKRAHHGEGEVERAAAAETAAAG
ncbi:MAG: 23S rRNA (adenine(2503)-C(2))-methyltransferase RlmN [Proteobacteria bacterium]|nr:23S rRNA (adenine(2503)-C(2))-methyltransferase RlmN [Pseudomonadota bacterium]